LSNAFAVEVGDKKFYRQYIRLSGGKVIIATPAFTVDTLTFRDNSPKNRSLLVPFNSWTREQIHILEDFVKANVSLPTDFKPQPGVDAFKPVWEGENVFISVSPWCSFFRYDSQSGNYKTMDSHGPFFRGSYHISVEVPYCYIGPHKEGQTYSLTLRVVQVLYHPETPQPIGSEQCIFKEVEEAKIIPKSTVKRAKRKPKCNVPLQMDSAV